MHSTGCDLDLLLVLSCLHCVYVLILRMSNNATPELRGNTQIRLDPDARKYMETQAYQQFTECIQVLFSRGAVMSYYRCTMEKFQLTSFSG